MAATTAIIVSTVATANYQANKQEQFQKDQQAIQGSQDATQRFAQRRRQLRERRIKAAQIEQASANTGTSGSSGEIGAVGTLSTDFAVNESVLRTEERLTAESRSAANRYTRGMNKAALAGAAIQGYQYANKMSELDTLEEDLFKDYGASSDGYLF